LTSAENGFNLTLWFQERWPCFLALLEPIICRPGILAGEGSATWATKIRVKNNEIVVLRYILFKPIVFCKEGNQLFTRAIVPKFFSGGILDLKHHLKECLSMTTTLHTLMHVEVEYTKGLDLLDLSAKTSVEKIAFSCLDESHDLITGSADEDLIV